MPPQEMKHPEVLALPQYEVAAHKMPADDDWTYQARKSANEGKGDVVFNQLPYVPVCAHMPTCKPQCEAPVFQWRKKEQKPYGMQ